MKTTLMELVWGLQDALDDEPQVTAALVSLIASGRLRARDGRSLGLGRGPAETR